MIIQFPWPAKELSPNFRSRSHWPKTNATAKARKLAWGLALAQRHEARLPSEGPIGVVYKIVPPDGRHRDLDNIIASLKPFQDGLCDALGVNDRRFLPTFEFAEPEKPGRVEVRFG